MAEGTDPVSLNWLAGFFILRYCLLLEKRAIMAAKKLCNKQPFYVKIDVSPPRGAILFSYFLQGGFYGDKSSAFIGTIFKGRAWLLY